MEDELYMLAGTAASHADEVRQTHSICCKLREVIETIWISLNLEERGGFVTQSKA
ncbi:hypothetical protein MTR_3g090655 [Medicago truncatula]|uniref:Uncharacterized protein n=1 Tax=Medicago truncatula TaxID=3880 RepID=A0A072V182_MEDTR|nr:hypothetical protein MTR_3g090655 [Medicago truncatula]